MSEHKFPPGPWHLDEVITDDHSSRIPILTPEGGVGEVYGRDETSIATGWMMVAAPEMLEALKLAERALCLGLDKDPAFWMNGGPGETALEAVISGQRRALEGVLPTEEGRPKTEVRVCQRLRAARERIAQLEEENRRLKPPSEPS